MRHKEDTKHYCKGNTATTETDMPHNYELECAVLGALLLESQYVADVRNILKTEAFYDTTNATIYETICRLDDNGTEPDIITVTNAVRETGIKPIDVTRLTSSVGSGVEVMNHAQQLADLEVRRKLLLFAAELSAKAQTTDPDTAQWATSRIDEIAGTIAAINTTRHCSEVITEALHDLECRQRARQCGECVGISTGLSDLDLVTGGWRGGQLVILAGRPAMGKTAISLTFTRAAAQSIPVCYFSLEMPAKQLISRMIVGSSGVDAGAYRSGDIGVDEWRNIETASDEIRNLPLYLFDTASISMAEIRIRCRAMQRKGRCGLIVIDYLQLLTANADRRTVNREREVADMSRAAKLLAKELNVPVILLAQLSRKVEERADKTPLLSDLRESGAIEQDADIVVFVDRPSIYGVKSFDGGRYGIIDSHGAGRLIVAKNREGATGFVLFRHNESLTRITDYNATQAVSSTATGNISPY